MKKFLLLAFLLLSATVFSGCIQRKEIVFTCPDGIKVAKQELCGAVLPEAFANDSLANGTVGEATAQKFPQELAASVAQCSGTQNSRQCVFESGFEKFGNDFCGLLYSFSSRECDAKNVSEKDACELSLFSSDVECTKELASSKGDKGLCELLANHFEGNDVNAAVSECKQSVATQSSTAYSSAIECEKLQQEEMDKCYAIVAGKSNDASLCEKSGNKDSCYAIFAATNGDAEYCARIVSLPTAAACFSLVAKKTGSAPLCNAIDNSTGLKEECFVGVAVSTANEALCPATVSYCKAAVKKDYLQCATEECVFEVATRNNDAAACATLSDDAVYGRYRCITLVATSLKKEDLCEQAGASKEICVARVKAFKDLPFES